MRFLTQEIQPKTIFFDQSDISQEDFDRLTASLARFCELEGKTKPSSDRKTNVSALSDMLKAVNKDAQFYDDPRINLYRADDGALSLSYDRNVLDFGIVYFLPLSKIIRDKRYSERFKDLAIRSIIRMAKNNGIAQMKETRIFDYASSMAEENMEEEPGEYIEVDATRMYTVGEAAKEMESLYANEACHNFSSEEILEYKPEDSEREFWNAITDGLEFIFPENSIMEYADFLDERIIEYCNVELDDLIVVTYFDDSEMEEYYMDIINSDAEGTVTQLIANCILTPDMESTDPDGYPSRFLAWLEKICSLLFNNSNDGN